MKVFHGFATLFKGNTDIGRLLHRARHNRHRRADLVRGEFDHLPRLQRHHFAAIIWRQVDDARK